MIYDSGRILLTQYILVTQYICYNVSFMITLFFKNPIFMVWVAFCLTYLFLKPNMYIFYLLSMIMIPFKTKYRIFATQYAYICFSRMVHF